MKSTRSKSRGPAGITGMREAAFRWSWLTLVVLLAGLYSGLGGGRPWGLLALVPAWFAFRSARLSRAADPLGRWKLVFLCAAVLCGAGALLLPLQPSRQLLERRGFMDDEALGEAMEGIRGSLETAVDISAAALSDPARGLGMQERLDAVWSEIRTYLGDESAYVALYREPGEPVVWTGSPYLVPLQPPATPGATPATGEGAHQFIITGDSLSASASVSRSVQEGTLTAGVLLYTAIPVGRAGPGAGSILKGYLPARVRERLQVRDTAVDEGVELVTGPWNRETQPYPGRVFLQTLLLLGILLLSLFLLSRDSSIVRGLVAAPLIYTSIVPLLLGVVSRPLTFELIAPSWTGYRLINQAFISVAAAALAIWFAVGLRDRVVRARGRMGGRLVEPFLFGGIFLIWILGLALLQDLFRFAPSWFWARVSFLPEAKDLIGWLIAIAMVLAVVACSGGAAAVLRTRMGGRGVAVAGIAAVLGGTAATLTGAWDGTALVGCVAALIGTVGVGAWLSLSEARNPLVVLLGVGMLGAVSLLPVKVQLGRIIVRRVIEESAVSLATTGAGIVPEDVDSLKRELRETAGYLESTRTAGDYPIAARENRTAYLVWKQLNLREEDLAGGIQIVNREGTVSGSFATVPDLFDVPRIDEIQAMLARGEGRMVLTEGERSHFGIETLLLGVPGNSGGPSLLVGIRRRLLGFMTEGEERLWTRMDSAGITGRTGRLGGELFIRVYDEAYGLLAMPLNPVLAAAPATVPLSIVEQLHEAESPGVWYRHGGLIARGTDEFYFRITTPPIGPQGPGVAVGEVEPGRRVACLGIRLPGLWGRVVEVMNVLMLFALSLLVIGWLPAAAVARSGIPIGRALRRVSFQTRLLIPLLVVALVPLVALWLLTRGFILNRERSAWEEGLDQSALELQRSIISQTESRAEELARESEYSERFGFADLEGGSQWAVFDSSLVLVRGNLSEALADRIPWREPVMARGDRSFLFRSGDELWSAAVAPVGPRFRDGAALVAIPFTNEFLRQATGGSPWHVDIYMDGRIRYSTEPGPYTAGLLPALLPRDAGWQGLRGREVGAFRWGSVGGVHYLYVYRPVTDNTGTAVATIAQRRFGLWGLSDPGLNQLFTTVASIYLLLVIAVTLVAVLVASRISQPIGDLTRSAVRVAGGDLEVEIPVTRGDEVGGLQKAFRQMVIALRENREELARAERERAWQEMARQVAHEIKNPLTPMQLSAQFLRRAYDEDAEDLGRIIGECTDAIVEQVEGLRRIANEFSAYARLPHVRREPTDLNQPVEDAINLFEPTLPDGVVIERELAPQLPSARLDAEQIRRVAINLIRNALDAMGDEGTLTIGTGSDEAGVWLEVSDTGEGIAPEVQERLFEPYFSTKTDGTGLGLAITRSIVDAYGGTLSVRSQPGEGTVVTAHFPFG